MTTDARTLEVSQLSKRYGGVVAVADVSLALRPAQIHGLIGPNGAGKSTTLALISGFVPADSGSVRWGDQEFMGASPLRIVQAGIARTFQGATPFRGMTVLDNLLVGVHTRGRSGLLAAMLRTPGYRRDERALRERAEQLLGEVGLDVPLDADAADLSFGQLRLLEIARALGTSPQALLLDEPAAGLNRQETDQLAAEIRRLKQRGVAVLVVDHDMPFVFGTCEWITVMNFGRVIASAEPRQVEVDPAVRAAYLSTAEDEGEVEAA